MFEQDPFEDRRTFFLSNFQGLKGMKVIAGKEVGQGMGDERGARGG